MFSLGGESDVQPAGITPPAPDTDMRYAAGNPVIAAGAHGLEASGMQRSFAVVSVCSGMLSLFSLAQGFYGYAIPVATFTMLFCSIAAVVFAVMALARKEGRDNVALSIIGLSTGTFTLLITLLVLFLEFSSAMVLRG